jgi:holo-[acyl-carrier protein] synthase
VIVGIGTDLVDVERFRLALGRRATLAERIFTPDEREYCQGQHDPAQSYAARFAAKEAVMKALGAGLGAFEFHDVSVTRADSGAPALVVVGKAQALADERGVTEWLLSQSHTTTAAIAVVLALG